MTASSEFGSSRFQIEYRDRHGIWMPITTPVGWFKNIRHVEAVRKYFSKPALGLQEAGPTVTLRYHLEQLNPHHTFRIVKTEVANYG